MITCRTDSCVLRSFFFCFFEKLEAVLGPKQKPFLQPLILVASFCQTGSDSLQVWVLKGSWAIIQRERK